MEILTVDFDSVSRGALEMAQFGFALKPVSTNNLMKATIRYTRDKKPYASVYPTNELEAFKAQLYNMLINQKKLTEWECLPRKYSFWVILREGHPQAEALDVNNVDKAILDTFVTAGLVPDDKHCRDCRAMYGDFNAADLHESFIFAVLIRWDDKDFE